MHGFRHCSSYLSTGTVRSLFRSQPSQARHSHDTSYFIDIGWDFRFNNVRT